MLDPDQPDLSPNKSPIRHGLTRTVRECSPGVKRGASEMGGSEREPDVDMTDAPKRHQAQNTSETETSTHTSDPGSVSQRAATDSTDTPSHSTSATSIEAPSTRDIPPIDEQVQRVTHLASQDPRDGQRGYIVSQIWLSRVQARSSIKPPRFDKSAIEGDIGPVDNKDLALITDGSGSMLDEAGEKFVPLKPGLALNVDYQILPEGAWDLIVEWYGQTKDSPTITRYAHTVDPAAIIPEMQYELEPPIFSVLKVPSEHTVQTQREADTPPQQMVSSKYMSAVDWLRKAKPLVHIEMATKVRVWRILGGLKSSSASGILTPGASRSASPAPGAEIIATAGDRMLLDANTLATLNPEQKQLLEDLKDLTNDPSYNGKSSLDMLGLGGSRQVVVLEEQKGGPAGGEWPSEHARLAKPKSQRDKVQGLTLSGRTSPAPGGMMTRGRAGKSNRPKGLVGFSNLGNTCYMNSALQCIRSVEELTQYFLTNHWKEDLNSDNPLGYGGQVAKAYAGLIKQIYEDSSVNASVNPSRFKSVIGKLNGSFAGYQQQDSQELFTFLLDGLSEDLNRIHKKPYVEKPDSTDEMVDNHQALKEFADKNWADYKARNDSVVTDLFAGMYKSQVTCPVCDKVSIIFDPFSNLTLQLPIANNWEKEVVFLPLHKRPIRIDVEIDKNASILALKEFVATRTGADPKKLVVAENYKNKFYKIFDNPMIMAEANIQANDIICVLELDSIPTNYNPNKVQKKSPVFTTSFSDDGDKLVDASSPEADRIMVPLFHRLVKSHGARSTISKPFFGLPTYLVIDREHNQSWDGVMKKILGNVTGMTSIALLDEPELHETSEDSDTVVTMDGSSSAPTAASDQNEDGFVDVSMRDPSLGPDATHEDADRVRRVINSKNPLPSRYNHLFDICLHQTNDGVATGWNGVTEHMDYNRLKDRLPKVVSQRPRKQSSTDHMSEDAGSEASDSDEGDIPHDDPMLARTDSSTESSASTPLPSTEESDNEVSMSKSSGKSNTKTYKDRARPTTSKGYDQRRATLTQQSSPPLSEDEGLIRPGEIIILDWTQEGYEALFGGHEDDEDEERGGPTWKSVDMLPDPDLEASRKKRSDRRRNGISLEDCLNEFGKPETLSEQNAWYCPRCKEHRRAVKKFELWKAPDILVMHLKRFSSNRNFRDKLEIRVDYPVEGLDITKMVQDDESGKQMIYDLIAVDNHYGGLGGGHYTAYGRNFTSGEWYEFNDAHVSRRDAAAVVTPAAYLLFYRRRSDHPLGGDKLEKMLVHEPESEFAPTTSRETSPHHASGSGEGQRLGDSSHNGSSSAYQVGQAHLVGDGGEDTVASRDQSLEMTAGGARRSIEANQQMNDRDDDLPPPYGEVLPDEGVSMDYDTDANTQPVWEVDPGWGWDHLEKTGGGGGIMRMVPPNSENRFGDKEETGSNDSTRVEGSDVEVDDAPVWSDGVSARGMRESAPPPQQVDTEMVSIPIIRTEEVDDEDDEELPVAELHAGEDGVVDVRHVPK